MIHDTGLCMYVIIKEIIYNTILYKYFVPLTYKPIKK